MDNIVLKQCIDQDVELQQVFCGFLLEDDVHDILGGSTPQCSSRRMNRLRLFLANTMLSRGIEQFPVAFFCKYGNSRKRRSSLAGAICRSQSYGIFF